MSPDAPEGQLHTLDLLEQLRAECSGYRENSSALYYNLDRLLMELANPNLHDIPGNFQNRVELWDREGVHLRWVVAAAGNVSIGHAAFEAAVANWPQERFTLRKGALLIREHPRDPTKR
jgi:hypothetical protein